MFQKQISHEILMLKTSSIISKIECLLNHFMDNQFMTIYFDISSNKNVR